MSANDERMRILEQIERGEISAIDGLRRLEELARQAQPAQPAEPEAAPAEPEPAAPAWGEAYASVLHPEAPPAPPEAESWKRWWQIPLAIGIGFIVLGALLMSAALQGSGFGFWFLCASIPLALGIAVAVMAWWSRSSRWLHIRVKTGQDSWPRTIAISLPIPIRLTAWLLRNFGQYLPPLHGTSLDELILALDSTALGSAPFYVDVNEGEDGERVQVFLG